MKISRNFALGAAVAALLAVPTLTETASAPAMMIAAKTPAAVASAKAQTEIKLSCSLKAMGTQIVTWIERQVE